MRRHLATIVFLAIAAAACGDAGSDQKTTSPTTSSAPEATTSTSTTAAATTTTTTTLAPTTTTTTPPRVRFPSGVAQMLPTGPEDWESNFIDPGGVVFHDGLFHSFYNGIDTWPAQVKVGYATSSDGKSWEKQSSDWLFTGERLDWSGTSLFLHDAIVLDDGTWAVYFNTVSSSTNFASGVIGMATAPQPSGPWTLIEDPVLQPGAEGAWDADGVVDPSVIRVGEQFWMYYDGNLGGRRAIGLATSEDGFSWTRSGEEPLLVAGGEGEWDDTGVYDPEVVVTDEGYVMSYFVRRSGTTAPVYEAGLAYSDDGLSWEKDPDGPYLSSDKWGFGGIFLSSLVHHDDEYVLYFDGQRSSGGTTAFYVAHEGPLRP